MMNTIKKVIMVVLVLITSCQVSENLKMGPVTAQSMIRTHAIIKAPGLPDALVTCVENLSKKRPKELGLPVFDFI